MTFQWPEQSYRDLPKGVQLVRRLLEDWFRAIEDGTVDPLPVFLDSPMAREATETYRSCALEHDAEMRELVREEMNVKEVVFRENEEELVQYRGKANYRVLGKILGKDMKAAASLIEQLGPQDLQRLVRGERIRVEVAGRCMELGPDEVSVERVEREHLVVMNDGSLTVGLDPDLTGELVQEGLVRDLIRGIQNIRKDAGLAVTDRIAVQVAGGDLVRIAGFVESAVVLDELVGVEDIRAHLAPPFVGGGRRDGATLRRGLALGLLFCKNLGLQELHRPLAVGELTAFA